MRAARHGHKLLCVRVSRTYSYAVRTYILYTSHVNARISAVTYVRVRCNCIRVCDGYIGLKFLFVKSILSQGDYRGDHLGIYEGPCTGCYNFQGEIYRRNAHDRVGVGYTMKIFAVYMYS